MRKLFLLLVLVLTVTSSAAASGTNRYFWPEDEELYAQYYRNGEFFPVQDAQIGATLDSITSRIRELKVPYSVRYNVYGWPTEVSVRMDFGPYRSLSWDKGSIYFDEQGCLRCVTSRIDTEDSFAALYEELCSRFGRADRIAQTCMDYDSDFVSYVEFESTTRALWIQNDVMYELEVTSSEKAEFDVNIWHGRSGREIEIDEPKSFAYLSIYDVRVQDNVLEKYE